ncbi:uncharacterized protein LOC113302065 [Papaver somniferum]|uniref:uncharacterized protein LOC113302065 n=1 Tax=Papaver somniferum TaxID=3469 RepID=UPI000E6F4AB9|nr:uncharacterized protein LOC113302065 [Papaver somniferum]
MHGDSLHWIITWFDAGHSQGNVSQSDREYKLHLLMIILWSIWKDRCAALFQNAKPNRLLSLSTISTLVENCKTKTNNNDITGVSLQVQAHKWDPPDSDYVNALEQKGASSMEE